MYTERRYLQAHLQSPQTRVQLTANKRRPAHNALRDRQGLMRLTCHILPTFLGATAASVKEGAGGPYASKNALGAGRGGKSARSVELLHPAHTFARRFHRAPILISSAKLPEAANV
jgi:hypothetical protein